MTDFCANMMTMVTKITVKITAAKFLFQYFDIWGGKNNMSD